MTSPFSGDAILFYKIKKQDDVIKKESFDLFPGENQAHDFLKVFQ